MLVIRRVWVIGKDGIGKEVEKLKDDISRLFILDERSPDAVVALGGEGTVFRVVKEYPNSSIFPVRKSSFGALSQIGERDVMGALDNIKKGKCFIEKIMRIEARYKSFRVWGINDVSVLRDDESANRFRIFLNDKDIYKEVLIGDGVICATPYGSTGYNWTAGGTVLGTKEKKFVLTPICSAYFNKRIFVKDRSTMRRVVGSKVIPHNKEVVVKFLRDAKIKIVADGRKEERRYINIKSGDRIFIRLSKETSRFLRIL